MLSRLLKFLNKVTDHCEENKMNGANIAIVFSPLLLSKKQNSAMSMFDNLQSSNDLIEYLIICCNNEDFFEKIKDEKEKE